MFRKLTQIPIFRTICGRQYLSIVASKVFERQAIKQFFGVNLVAAIIFTGVVSPETSALLDLKTIEAKSEITPISVDLTTDTTFEMPLRDFKISQTFTMFWHPGVDLTAPYGTSTYAIAEGDVIEAEWSYWGYGKYILLQHDKNYQSRYAHLSNIEVKNGEHIARGQLIGQVGSTGWSTGNHLHLEVYRDGTPQNPLELLPLTIDETKSSAFFQQTVVQKNTPTLETQPL